LPGTSEPAAAASEIPVRGRVAPAGTVEMSTYRLKCPHCSADAQVAAVQGDRCPQCRYEFTLFEPDQEIIVREFYEVLTGMKYLVDLPGGVRVVVHG